jgi:cell wall assembly regulator SMI1
MSQIIRRSFRKKITMRKTFLIIMAVLAIAGFIYFLSNLFYGAGQAPIPASLPPVVDESMDSLLQSLESELEKHRPDVIQSLLPGITPEELEHAEALLGQAIHPEMQALYRWHNGLANGDELFPGYGFWSLENAIQTNQEFALKYQEKGVSLLMAHEKNWLTLFPDVAGDGYYYDPMRTYENGCIFYIFRESNYYRYFPSVKNLLKAIVDCYQNGVYPQGADPNFEVEEQIMDKYGVAIEAH